MRLSELILETESSWIGALEYKENSSIGSGDIILRTKSGKQYEVNDVPKDVYDAWAASGSAGTFFHQNIKDQYTII